MCIRDRFRLFNLFENLRVLDNVTIGLRKVKKIPKEQAEKKAMELLKQVGLESKADEMCIRDRDRCMSVWQQEKRKPLSTLSTISTFVDV